MKKFKWISSIFATTCVAGGLVPALVSCAKNTKEEKKDTSVYRSNKVNSDLYFANDVQKFVDKLDMKYAYDLGYKLAYDESLGQCLGWRAAGSEAEHKTGEFLKEEMEKIGLSDVAAEKIACDSFDFKESSLEIDGEVICHPASYQMTAWGEWVEDEETHKLIWKAKEYAPYIVDLGEGKEIDYLNKEEILEKIKDNGYIALIGVDQVNGMWIDNYIREAQAHDGCAGIITYTVGGFGQVSKDAINVQDVCAGIQQNMKNAKAKTIGFPTLAVSYNEAQKIKGFMNEEGVIEEGHCKISVNAKVTTKKEYLQMQESGQTIDQPFTYDVIGRIPGKNRERQIVLSAHYDKYFYGFQDDSLGVGLMMAVAKALVESGYQPEYDIAFCLTGAEEWGRSDSNFDWAAGAWGLLNWDFVDSCQSEYDWDFDESICVINCELPGFKTDAAHKHNVSIGGCPEVGTMIKDFVKSGLCVTSGDVGIEWEPFISSINDDGIAYRASGIPNFVNYFDNDEFRSQRYHTNFDDKSTIDLDTLRTNGNWFGALAIYMDKMAAPNLDLSYCFQEVLDYYNDDAAKATVKFIEEYYEPGILTEDDLKSLVDSAYILKEYANLLVAKMEIINHEYNEAMKTGEENRIALWKEKAEEVYGVYTYYGFNMMNRSDFLSDGWSFLIINTDECFYGDKTITDNYENLNAALKAVENKNIEDTLKYLSLINAGRNKAFVEFSEETGDKYFNCFSQEYWEQVESEYKEKPAYWWDYTQYQDVIYKYTWGWHKQLNSVTGAYLNNAQELTKSLGALTHDFALAHKKGVEIPEEGWTALKNSLTYSLMENCVYYAKRLYTENYIFSYAVNYIWTM